jgi:hypothetical protein
MEIIFALTVMTAGGPVTVEPYRMGPFDNAVKCAEFGEAIKPNIERLTRALSGGGFGFDSIQPFALQHSGTEMIVSFRCE